MTKLVTLGILLLCILLLASFILALRAAAAGTLVILGISSIISFILTLGVVLVDKLAISGISSSIFFILALYISFLTTSFHHLVYLNQQGQVIIY